MYIFTIKGQKHWLHITGENRMAVVLFFFVWFGLVFSLHFCPNVALNVFDIVKDPAFE